METFAKDFICYNSHDFEVLNIIPVRDITKLFLIPLFFL